MNYCHTHRLHGIVLSATFDAENYAVSELAITQLDEKLQSAKKDFLNEANRTLTLKGTLKKIKIDLHNMTANFQDPMKLKLNVKVSYGN